MILYSKFIDSPLQSRLRNNRLIFSYSNRKYTFVIIGAQLQPQGLLTFLPMVVLVYENPTDGKSDILGHSEDLGAYVVEE